MNIVLRWIGAGWSWDSSVNSLAEMSSSEPVAGQSVLSSIRPISMRLQRCESGRWFGITRPWKETGMWQSVVNCALHRRPSSTGRNRLSAQFITTPAMFGKGQPGWEICWAARDSWMDTPWNRMFQGRLTICGNGEMEWRYLNGQEMCRWSILKLRRTIKSCDLQLMTFHMNCCRIVSKSRWCMKASLVQIGRYKTSERNVAIISLFQDIETTIQSSNMQVSHSTSFRSIAAVWFEVFMSLWRSPSFFWPSSPSLLPPHRAATTTNRPTNNPTTT